MGNCQAIDNATLVIQHPSGRVDKMYWPVTAAEVMKTNPGHYVALLLTTTTTSTSSRPSTTAAAPCNHNNSNLVRITRIKLLRPTDTLSLGQAYRLITTQEVMKGLWAKKYAKIKKKQSDSAGIRLERRKGKLGSDDFVEAPQPRRSEMEKTNQVSKENRYRPAITTQSANSSIATATAKSKSWQPSLKSISEGGAAGN
ncbi:hypothetical protein U1Q18_027461 [Sarracenia purpurea var. burkii]